MQKQEVSLSVSSPHCVLKNFQASSSLATEEDTNQRQRLTFPTQITVRFVFGSFPPYLATVAFAKY
ncbi:hypothetical protein [Coleofasciculus sp. FACHB-T130]|uniref:hypothetical protein n=1 Tax=Cyanophyceae TaxID=3028117 RepID=UPI001685139F|nr:hypothetical protein [Coleofasciculus sp. FACHB-T130]MBD1879999.1 hypothetical protein [Coleofasciculus sp. FACHB-T130]